MLIKLSNFLYKRDGDDPQLVIQSGLTPRQLRSADIKVIKNSPGYILKESSIETWNIESSEEIENGVCFIGPYIKGKSLASVKKLDKSIFTRLLRGFDLFEEENWEFRYVSPESIFLCDNGDILVLPPPLMSFILNNLSDKEKTEIVNPYTHPSLEGRELYSFFLGVLIYQTLTGDLPFASDSIVELNERIRRGYFVDLRHYRNNWRGAVTKTVTGCLKTKAIPNREKWNDFLDMIEEFPLGDSLEDSALTKKRESSAKKEKISLFLRKQAKTIVVLSILVLIVGIVAGSILKSVFKPSLIKGFSSIEVVETFYGCFESLDDSLMRSCLTGRRVARQDLRALSYISVMSKQKKVYMGSEGLIKAIEWDSRGRPAMEPFINLFGITDLKITEISSLEYQVEYLRWTTVHDGDLITDEISRREDVSIFGTKVKDTLYLEQRKNRFLIAEIKRQEEMIYQETVLWEEK